MQADVAMSNVRAIRLFLPKLTLPPTCRLDFGAFITSQPITETTINLVDTIPDPMVESAQLNPGCIHNDRIFVPRLRTITNDDMSITQLADVQVYDLNLGQTVTILAQAPAPVPMVGAIHARTDSYQTFTYLGGT